MEHGDRVSQVEADRLEFDERGGLEGERQVSGLDVVAEAAQDARHVQSRSREWRRLVGSPGKVDDGHGGHFRIGHAEQELMAPVASLKHSYSDCSVNRVLGRTIY